MLPGACPLPVQVVSCNEKYQCCLQIKLDTRCLSRLGFYTHLEQVQSAAGSEAAPPAQPGSWRLLVNSRPGLLPEKL